ncbi:MAG: hypothetical protein AB1774_06020, partial [Bacillota bacterium]
DESLPGFAVAFQAPGNKFAVGGSARQILFTPKPVFDARWAFPSVISLARMPGVHDHAMKQWSFIPRRTVDSVSATPPPSASGQVSVG